jgi:hypothetical protein
MLKVRIIYPIRINAFPTGSIMKNDVWDIMPRSEGELVVSSMWLYKVKHATHDNIEKFIARFVARGLSKSKGVDYNETFSPVAMYTSIRVVMSLVSFMGWRIY